MKDPNSNPDMIPQKPERFEEMKEYAAELAKGIKHLRVDFYQIGGGNIRWRANILSL